MSAKDLKCWLATPTGGGMDPEYCSSLVRTYKRLHKEGFHAPRYINNAAAEIPNLLRLLQSMKASNEEEQGIFWVGADHSWTPEDYIRILEAAVAHPDAIIGGMYISADGTTHTGTPVEGAPPVATDLYPAVYLGWGFIWTPWSAFDKIQPPFWQWGFKDDPAVWKGWMAGPDFEFSRKAREAGVQVLIHAAVLDVGHAQRREHTSYNKRLAESRGAR